MSVYPGVRRDVTAKGSRRIPRDQSPKVVGGPIETSRRVTGHLEVGQSRVKLTGNARLVGCASLTRGKNLALGVSAYEGGPPGPRPTPRSGLLKRRFLPNSSTSP